MIKIVPHLAKVALVAIIALATTFTGFSQEISSEQSAIEAGKTVFENNCAQCHAVHKKVLGPALANVYERRSIDWLKSWVKNSQAFIASGDEDAIAIYEEYGKVQMPAYPFSDEKILNIMAYVKAETEKGPPKEVAATGAEGEAVATSAKIPTYLYVIIGLLLLILIIAVSVLVMAAKALTGALKDKEDSLDEEGKEVLNQKFSLASALKSNAVVGFAVFILTIVMLKTLIDGAFTIGVQQNYQPKQPIAFSHKIHAGQYEIDCQYCHTGVRKSKSANIPSPNICMNCHTQVKTESPEIQKIYEAIDYDPATRTYGTNTKPIEWIRIHNLPDLAYFNHSQHVKVAGLECQTCHGPIQEMEVVYQYSNLTMGWCINCHRETDVNTKGNDYYNKLVKLHKEKSKEPMKVEDIGGLECGKCHY